MMVTDKKRVLYDTLANDYDLGEFDSFVQALGNEQSRRNLYNAIVDEYDVRDFDSFSAALGFGEQQKPQKETQQVQQDSAQAYAINPMFGTALPQPEVQQPIKEMDEGAVSQMVTQMSGIKSPGEMRDEEAQRRADERQAQGDNIYHPYGKDKPLISAPDIEVDKGWRPRYNAESVVDESMRRAEEALTPTSGMEGAIERSTEKAVRNYIKQNATEALADLDSRIDKSIRARGEQLDKDAEGSNSWLADMASSGGAGHMPAYARTNNLKLADEEYTTLQAAAKMLDSSKQMIYDATHQDGWTGGFFTKLGQKVIDPSLWDMGLSDVNLATHLLKVVDKEDRGEALTEAEQILLDTAVNNTILSGYYQGQSTGQFIAEVTAESIPFMVEMAINPLSGLGKTAAKGVAKYITKKLGTEAGKEAAEGLLKRAVKGLPKMAARVAGDAAGVYGMTLTTGAGLTAADAMSRMTGQIVVDYDKDGAPVYAGREGAKSRAEAIKDAINAGAIERGSEMLGNYFAPVLGVAGRGAAKGLNKVGLGSVNKLIADFGKKDAVQAVHQFLDRTQWHGFIGEYGEEIAGGMLNAAIVGDQTMDEVLSKDNLVDTALGLSVMSVVFPMVATGGYAMAKNRERKKLRAAEEHGRKLFRSAWDDFADAIHRAKSAEEMRDNLRAVMEAYNRQSVPQEDMMALMDYATAYNTYKAVDEISNKAIFEGVADQHDVERMHLFEEGMAATDKHGVRQEYEAARAKIEHLGLSDVADIMAHEAADNFEAAGDMQTANDIRSYIAARAMHDGMVSDMFNEAQKKKDEAFKEIDAQANGDGNIYLATTAEGEGYITGGTVILDAEGRIDEDATAEANENGAVYVNVGGRVLTKRPIEISGVAPVQSAETLKAQRKAEIDAELDARYEKETARVESAPVAEDAQAAITANAAATLGVQQSELPMYVPDRTKADEMISGYEQVGDTQSADAMRAYADAMFGAVTQPATAQTITQTNTAQPTTQPTAQTATAPAAQAAPVSALSSIPTDEQGVRLYEQADSETAWDAIVEEAEGDEAMAQRVIASTIKDVEAEIKRKQKETPKGATIAEKIAAEKQIKGEMAALQEKLAKWQGIAGVQQARVQSTPAEVLSTETPGIAPTEAAAPAVAADAVLEETAATTTPEEAAVMEETDAEMPTLTQQMEARADAWVTKVGVPVEVVHDIAQVSNKEAYMAIQSGQQVAGWYETNSEKVYIYIPGNRSVSDIDKTYIHEVIAHHGVEKLLGKEGFARFCDGVWDIMGEAERKQYLEYVNADPTNPTTAQKRIAADEYVAALAERMDLSELEQGVWSKIVEQFIKLLEAAGFTNLKHEDISAVLKASYANLRKEAAQQTAIGQVADTVNTEQTETPQAETQQTPAETMPQMPLGEKEYADKRSAEIMAQNQSMDEVDAYNMALDEYPAYIGQMIESGEMANIYANASVGERIALNKMIQTAGREISEVRKQETPMSEETPSRYEIGRRVQAEFADGSIINGTVERIANGKVSVRGENGRLYTVEEKKVNGEIRTRIVAEETEDVAREDQIFLEENLGVSESVEGVTPETEAATVQPNGNVRFSVRTALPWVDNLGNKHEGTMTGVLRRMEERGFSPEEVKEMQMKMQTAFDYMMKLSEMTDEEGHVRFEEFNEWAKTTPMYKQVGRDYVKAITSLVSNGDYPVNLELTTDCIKREGYTKLLNELVRRGADLSGLNAAEIVTIQMMMKQYGIETACDLCFVEGKRLQIVNWATQIVEDWNAALEEAGITTDEYFGFGKDGEQFIPSEEWRSHTDKPKLLKALLAIDNAALAMQGIDPKRFKEQERKNRAAVKKYKKEKAEAWAKKKKKPASQWKPTDEQKREIRKMETEGLTPTFVNKNTNEFREAFEALRNEWLEKHPGKDPLSFTPTQAQWATLEKIRNKQIERVKQKMVRLIMEYPEMRKKMAINDLLGANGLMEIRSQHGEAYEQLYSIILSRFGTGTPKPVQYAVPYDGEVMTLSEAAFKRANEIGGARLFSFSDFDITKVFDYMQMFFDLEVNGQRLQSYTKEVPAVLIFGKSNAKFNISTLANAVVPESVLEEYKGASEARKQELRHEWAENAGLIVDSQGNIIGINYSKEHSVSPDFAKAIFHDDSRNKDCGAIMVGASVNHAIYSAAQEWIRMVIPFHLSGMPMAAREKTDVLWYTDNTAYQSTRKKTKDGWSKISSNEDTFSFYDNMNEEGWNMRDKAREYLDWCAQNGYRPKFDWGINSDYYRAYCEEQGYTPNQEIIDMMDADTVDGVWNQYYKFLTDFTAYKPVFNEHGEMIDEIPSPQMPVKSNFEMNEREQRLLFEGDNSMLQRRETNIRRTEEHIEELADKVEAYLKGDVTEDDLNLRNDVYYDNAADANAYLSETGTRFRTGEDTKQAVREAIIPFAKELREEQPAREAEAMEAEIQGTRFRVVDDPAMIAELESGEKATAYRAMALIDDKLYPPMSVYVDGKLRNPTEEGVWEMSDETPFEITEEHLAKAREIDANWGSRKSATVSVIPGKVRMAKSSKGGEWAVQFKLLKDNGEEVWAAYNPYFHTSSSAMNDQFTTAYKRPNLVVVEVEIPKSELDGAYKAKYAKDSVGQTPWKSGVVNTALPADKQRAVTLSRYAKVVRVVSDAESAKAIAEQLEGTNVTVPFNVVTPGVRDELVKLGVQISEPTKGNAGNSAIPTYNDWKEQETRFSIVGGNKGYVGYSMSKRAAEAREEGRFPKIDFKKEYKVSEGSFNALVDAGIIDSGEWHHTSKYGNRTPFYGWSEESYAGYYAEHKKEIDALAKDVAAKIEDAKRREAEFRAGWKSYEYPADFDWRPVDRRNEELEELEELGELSSKERIAILHEEFPEMAEAEAHNNVQREFSRGIEAEIREQRQRIADAFPKETRFRISPEMDAEYMDAVNNGDMATAERLVKEAAKLAMPDTKAVDENGYPMVVYHQTNSTIYRNIETGENWDSLDWKAKQEWEERDDWEDYWVEEDFYEFDNVNYGRRSVEMPAFFFSPKYDEYHEYGKRTISAFLNLRNPAINPTIENKGVTNTAGEDAMNALIAKGYDGFIREYDGIVKEVNAFFPSQIKSAEPVTYDDNGNVIPLSERFNEEKNDIRFRKEPFYSNAERATEEIKQSKATPEQWIAMLKKNGGLKAGEDAWLGLEEWLKTKKGAVTKEEILDYIDTNKIQIEEVEYGEFDYESLDYDEDIEIEAEAYEERIAEEIHSMYGGVEGNEYEKRARIEERLEDKYGESILEAVEVGFYGSYKITNPKHLVELMSGYKLPKTINSTRLDYTTDGLENKREIALVVPTIEPYNASDDVHFGDAGEGRAIAWVRFGETTDEEGNRVLVIDEIQSKRHQDGREKGYKDESAAGEIEKQIEELLAEQEQIAKDILHKNGYIYHDEEGGKFDYDEEYSALTGKIGSKEQMARQKEIDGELYRLNHQLRDRRYGVPGAPFEKNWHELAFKRMLRYAAENGYDKVAWTTGEQQAERYNIGAVLKGLEAYKASANGYYVTPYNNGVIGEFVKEYTEQELADTFGKELAQKIIANAENATEENPYEIEGEELRVGGEGMKGFYDKMLPSFVSKYVKKWGAKVGEVTMPELAENNTMHSVDVTPDMKESVMQGQTMFRKEVQRTDADIAKAVSSMPLPVEIAQGNLDAHKRSAKGWYENGKVFLNLDNATSVEDAVETVLHNMVAHKGLTGVLGERYDNWLDEMYAELPKENRKAIMQRAIPMIGKGDFLRAATEQYIAENVETLMPMIREKMRGLLGYEVSDNELRYMLWKTNSLRRFGNGMTEMVRNSLMEEYLGVGNTRFRTPGAASPSGSRGRELNAEVAIGAVRDIYEARLMTSGYQAREAIQDSMLSLKVFQEAIEKIRGEELPDFMNAYFIENALSSKNKAEADAFERMFFHDVVSALAELHEDGMEYDAVYDYLMAKHGIERNREMAVKEALTEKGVLNKDAYKEWMEKKHEIWEKELTWHEKQKELDDLARKYGADPHKDFAGLSDMFENDYTDGAYRMVLDVEMNHDMNKLLDAVKRCTDATLAMQQKKGMMSRETHDMIADMYEFYVPLRGFEAKTAEDVYEYMTSSISPVAKNKIAKGRKSKADNPLAWIANMAESAIVQGNRNELKNAFFNLVAMNPTDLVSVSDKVYIEKKGNEWVIALPNIPDDATAEEVREIMQLHREEMKRKVEQDPDLFAEVNNSPDIPYRVLTQSDMNEHQVLVRRHGKMFTLTVNGNPRLAQAINGLTNPDTDVQGIANKIFEMGEKINRQLSAFYTTRNPDFIVSNFFRDIIYTNSMVWVKENPKYAMRFNRNCMKLNPAKMWTLIRRYHEGKLDMSNETEKMFKEFMMNGGETGYTNLKDVEARKKQLSKELTKGKTRQAWDTTIEWLDEVNRAVENCARFAAYMTSRQEGRGIVTSIHDAKEISVNFNKKGAGAKFMDAKGQTAAGRAAAFSSGLGRALYVFYNAGVQGLSNVGSVAKKNPKKFGALAGTLTALGMIVPMLFGDDDDKEENDYMNLPEHVRRTHLCLRAPYTDGFITLPLPIEYRAMYGAAEYLTNVFLGREELKCMTLLEQVTQILPIDPLGDGGFNALVPSWYKPVHEVRQNVSWTGMPIAKQNVFNEDKPEYRRVYDNVSNASVEFSKALSVLGGGNRNRRADSEWCEWNPAKIEYLLSGYLGGVASFPGKVYRTAEAVFSEDKDVAARDIPLVNRIYKEGNPNAVFRRIDNAFYENRTRWESFGGEMSGWKKDMKDVELSEEERNEAYKEYNRLRTSSNHSTYLMGKAYLKRIEELEDAYKATGDEGYKEMVYEIKKQFNELMKRYE